MKKTNHQIVALPACQKCGACLPSDEDSEERASNYFGPPYFYERVAEGRCLACHLGVGPRDPVEAEGGRWE